MFKKWKAEMDIRVPCQMNNCSSTILPITAQDTGGICRPCFIKRKRQQEEKFIADNRKNINLFKDLNNPIDIIKNFHGSRPYDQLINYENYSGSISKQYKTLDTQQQTELLNFSIKLYKEKKEREAKEIVSCLIAFTNSNIADFLREMIEAEDYAPPYLFKNSTPNIQEILFNIFLKNENIEGDLFECLVLITESSPILGDNIDNIRKFFARYRRSAFEIKSAKKATRNDGYKKNILGNVNIIAQGESWPICDNVYLNPVIQLAISELPYVPKELEGIKYLCVYIHPDDPGSLLDRDDALVIRTYTDESLMFIEPPKSIIQESSPIIINFENKNDYPCNYQYPNFEQYLSYKDYYSGDKEYISISKDSYNWKNDFPNSLEEELWVANDCKILGWPKWLQWPEEPENSTFIMQIDNYGLWEYGDTSTLYIFKNNMNQKFEGFIQML